MILYYGTLTLALLNLQFFSSQKSKRSPLPLTVLNCNLQNFSSQTDTCWSVPPNLVPVHWREAWLIWMKTMTSRWKGETVKIPTRLSELLSEGLFLKYLFLTFTLSFSWKKSCVLWYQNSLFSVCRRANSFLTNVTGLFGYICLL